MDNAETSTALNELINSRPIWIVRNGYTILFIFVFSLFITSWMVKYPVRERFSVRSVTTSTLKDTTIKYEITGEPSRLQILKVNQDVVLRFRENELTRTEHLRGRVSSVIIDNKGVIAPRITVDFHDKANSIWINYPDGQIVAEVIIGRSRVFNNIVERIRRFFN